MSKRGSLVISDPRVIRALAHPARLAVLDALADGGELTATACAESAGVSPSAMSYHLRALQKFGFVERADHAGDGRERPWRLAVDSWGIDELPDAGTAAATSSLTKLSLDRVMGELSRWLASKRHQPAAWRKVVMLENRQRWLTTDEAAELRAVYDKFLERTEGRTAARHPQGARRVRLVRVLVPVQVDDPQD